MSWQSYVDEHLIASGNVTKAAIIGIANADTWATAEGFNVRATRARHPSCQPRIGSGSADAAAARPRAGLACAARILAQTRGCLE